MNFADFGICGFLVSNERDAVIREMVLKLAKEIPPEEIENIIKAVLRREGLGTTAIGHGVAVPHAKCSHLEHTIGAVAISKEGVDFYSLDKEDCNVIILLLSPPENPGDHLRALEKISRKIKQKDFCESLSHAQNEDEIKQILIEADKSV